MGKITSWPPFVGTRDHACIYKMYGQYYIRAASTLDGRRVKKDPTFRKTMQYAALLGNASRIGSIVYHQLPLYRKKHALYRKLTGEAMQWLKYQWAEQDIIAYLLEHNVQQPVAGKPADSTSLRPSYCRKTQRVKQDRRRKKPVCEQARKKEALFTVSYYQRLHQKLRRNVQEEISGYWWAT